MGPQAHESSHVIDDVQGFIYLTCMYNRYVDAKIYQHAVFVILSGRPAWQYALTPSEHSSSKALRYIYRFCVLGKQFPSWEVNWAKWATALGPQMN